MAWYTCFHCLVRFIMVVTFRQFWIRLSVMQKSWKRLASMR